MVRSHKQWSIAHCMSAHRTNITLIVPILIPVPTDMNNGQMNYRQHAQLRLVFGM